MALQKWNPSWGIGEQSASQASLIKEKNLEWQIRAADTEGTVKIFLPRLHHRRLETVREDIYQVDVRPKLNTDEAEHLISLVFIHSFTVLLCSVFTALCFRRMWNMSSVLLLQLLAVPQRHKVPWISSEHWAGSKVSEATEKWQKPNISNQ